MAHKKAGGSSRNGRDSAGKRLGVKLFGGQTVNAGSIIVTQRGTKMIPGDNVYAGRQHSLHAAVSAAQVFCRVALGHGSLGRLVGRRERHATAEQQRRRCDEHGQRGRQRRAVWEGRGCSH